MDSYKSLLEVPVEHFHDAEMLTELFSDDVCINFKGSINEPALPIDSEFLDSEMSKKPSISDDEIDEAENKPSRTSWMDKYSYLKNLRKQTIIKDIKSKHKPKNEKKPKPKKPSDKLMLDYFEPISRAVGRLKTGDTFKAKVYQKVTGTKDRIVGAADDDFDRFGRRCFVGSIQKQQGNLLGKMHLRWVVVRGWSLYWYRLKGAEIDRQKGILNLPSTDIVVLPPTDEKAKDDKKLGF